MKKILAVVLACMMAFSLLACSGATTSASPSTSAASANTSSVPSAAPTASTAASTTAAPSPSAAVSSGTFVGPDWIPSPIPSHSAAGWYTDNVDWFARPAYKLAFVYIGASSLTDQLSKAFQDWGEKLNFTYTEFNANNDADALLNAMHVLANEGVQGMMIEPDMSIGERVKEVAAELNIAWMPAIMPIMDENGNLAYPQVTLGTKYQADLETDWLANNYKTYWGDIDTSKLGYICLSFNGVSQLKIIYDYSNARFKELYPNNAQYVFNGDTTSYGIPNADAGYNVVSAVVAAHPEVEHWFITTCLEDVAIGAARAVDALGKSKNTLIISNGGEACLANWKEGVYSDSWVACVYFAEPIFAEPMVCGIVAMLDGRATPETLWPEWKAPGAQYSNVMCETKVLTKDTYKDYLNYVDNYLST